MTKRKIVITLDLEQRLIDQVKNAAPDWELIVGKDPSIWEDEAKDAEIILSWKRLLNDSFADNPNLRWIQAWSAGINYLPLEKFEEKDIILTCAKGVHAYPISETIFAFMLAFTRKIDTYVKNQKDKKWNPSDIKHEIHGKTVGIVGVGTIGQETARIAKAFGMHVIGVRHSGNPLEYVDKMVTSLELDSILPKCDFIVVTLPLTKDTHHLFSKKQFELMKSSAYFINIGRGEITDEQALYTALKDGQIAGAGLDVFETEPLPTESPLWDLENVIITPHTSGSTEHYEERVIEQIFLPNFKQYLEGNTPDINLIDYKKGY
ncbi:D-2-hydroxyacid dehydrogenase [Cytobacillus purgationiresistens]|uniref:Phosphoglycerate dehydrogenase-like enzyme n=1 Tax=Cytobacillus purgationiresistens TaxID=863449 RepID=A0ABU0AQ85_9BACI|nr:D-2-hydroxyacid dehydrogenase [Cytobacillus purgationiresistens]MDQ0273461.1 phosphoglycerate dehydrogenase-like enzyme [Cytobacillus purgationiresistens]